MRGPIEAGLCAVLMGVLYMLLGFELAVLVGLGVIIADLMEIARHTRRQP